MWLWCLTVSFYGFSLWLYVLEPQGSFCRLLVYMMSGNLQIVKSQTLLGQAKDLNWGKKERTHQDPLILANIIYHRGQKIKKTLLISSGKNRNRYYLSVAIIQRHLATSHCQKDKKIKETLQKRSFEVCAKIKIKARNLTKKKSFSRSEKKTEIIFFKTKLHEKIIVMKKKLTCEFSLNNQNPDSCSNPNSKILIQKSSRFLLESN